MTRLLMLGQSGVLDCLVTDAVVADWSEDIAELDAQLYVVECVCSDEALHRSRVDGRERRIPGWHEIGWDHVQRMRVEFPPLRADRLNVDAIRPVEENHQAVLGYIAD